MPAMLWEKVSILHVAQQHIFFYYLVELRDISDAVDDTFRYDGLAAVGVDVLRLEDLIFSEIGWQGPEVFTRNVTDAIVPLEKDRAFALCFSNNSDDLSNVRLGL